MENYARFCSNFQKFKKAKQFGVGYIENDSPLFIDSINQGLSECHIFEIKNTVKRLLIMTKNPKKNDKVKLPFPFIFIDVDFKKDEVKNLGFEIGYEKIMGVLISEAKLVSKLTIESLKLLKKSGYTGKQVQEYFQNKENTLGKALRISICSKFNGEIKFDTFNINVNLSDASKNYEVIESDNTDFRTKKLVKCFVLNFLNFLNSPEIEYKTVEYGKKKNQKRVERGKKPIPVRNFIKVKGKLKKYINQLKNDKTTWSYSHRFWVRGHWRTLKSKERWGNKSGTRIWIKPYIKGKGILFEKKYSLEGSD